MAGWAAQLQSIQSLAARLTGMLTVREIGMAMAGELDQLIDYHSIRIYRISGNDLVPVAWRGNAGIYLDTDGAELRGRVGRGIVGWVAEHGVAQYVPNASLDPRGVHIPGTPEIEESMLVAPLACEGRSLGVVALSKLGVDAFTEDHERLLQIYATFAAQAMANADANEQLRLQSETLRKQLHSQRELLRVTESLLTTLDPRAVLEEIADRLGALVEVDNLVVDLHDRERGILEPIVARGTHAAEFLARPLPDGEGVCGWVLQHGIGQLVPDELADPRVAYFAEHGPVAGTLIVVPLRGRVGVAGVMTLERLGPGREFTGDEFDLVQLFGAQASIALQNAETHQEISVRAQTDALTGLRNQGTFHDVLGRWVARSDPFSLLIIDLDHFKGSTTATATRRGTGCSRRSRRRWSSRAATRTPSSATAATSSPCSFPRPTPRGRMRSRRSCRARSATPAGIAPGRA
jgi:GAF domain-containing protein